MTSTTIRRGAAGVALAALGLLGCAGPASARTVARHVTVPDNGVQQTCPAAWAGEVVFVHVRGTHVNFTARCDRDGRVYVLDAR